MLKKGTKGVSKSNFSLRRMQLERGTSECKTRCVSECRVEGARSSIGCACRGLRHGGALGHFSRVVKYDQSQKLG